MDFRHLISSKPTYVRGKCDSFNSYNSSDVSSHTCRCTSVSPVGSIFSSASSISPPPETREDGEVSNYVDYHPKVEAEKQIVFGLFAKDSDIKTCKQPKCISQHSIQSFATYFHKREIDESADFAEMFDLAAAFKVPVLKNTCIKKIKENIYQYGALDIYNLGHFHACMELKEAAFALIQETFPDLENAYIKCPNAINMLLTSIHEIVEFMP